MKRLLVTFMLLLALPTAAQSIPGGAVFIWGPTISSESLGLIGGHMIVGPFHSFDACIAFLALMQREGAGLGFVSPNLTILEVAVPGVLFCVQIDSQGNLLMVGQASGENTATLDHGWMAGGWNPRGYLFGIGPLRARESCSTILGTMHREGAGIGYFNREQTVTQVVQPSSLACTYI